MIYSVLRCYELCVDFDFSFLSEPLTELASKSPTGFVMVLTLVISIIIILTITRESIKHYRELAEISMTKTEEAYRNAFLLATNNQEKIAEINSINNSNDSDKKKRKLLGFGRK